MRAAAAKRLGGSLTEATTRVLLKATKGDYRVVRVRAADSLASIDPCRLDIGVDGRALAPNPRKAVDAAMNELRAGLGDRCDIRGGRQQPGGAPG